MGIRATKIVLEDANGKTSAVLTGDKAFPGPLLYDKNRKFNIVMVVDKDCTSSGFFGLGGRFPKLRFPALIII